LPASGIGRDALPARSSRRTSRPDDVDLLPLGRGRELEGVLAPRHQLDRSQRQSCRIGSQPRGLSDPGPPPPRTLASQLEARPQQLALRSSQRELAPTSGLRGRRCADRMNLNWVMPAEGERWATLPLERPRSEEHTSELQSRGHLVCRLLLEKKKNTRQKHKHEQK